MDQADRNTRDKNQPPYNLGLHMFYYQALLGGIDDPNCLIIESFEII